MDRPIDKPFRLHISDVFKGVGSGFSVSGRVGAGHIQSGDRVLVTPVGVTATIKGICSFLVDFNLCFMAEIKKF